MLKQIRFKNWRSLRDVMIDMAPITIFIGANSSGKTNIVDGLRFVQTATTRGLNETIARMGYRTIQSKSAIETGIVEIELTFSELTTQNVVDSMYLKFEGRNFPYQYARRLSEGQNILEEAEFEEFPLQYGIGVPRTFAPDENWHEIRTRRNTILQLLIQQYKYRWQLLNDQFSPPLQLSGSETGDLYVLDPNAQNMLLILELLKEGYPNLYSDFINDVSYLTSHVSKAEIYRQLETRDIELLVFEEDGQSGPTVSTGTRRLMAMLTALYALDLPHPLEKPPFIRKGESPPRFVMPTVPGLIVIEEPDAALNPGVLQSFVEILRRFTSDSEKPRQVILTTHNPTFLNYFEPEEVRIVERGEDGYSTVKTVPDHIRDVWLKDGEYGLGEVWMTNSFGGMPW